MLSLIDPRVLGGVALVIALSSVSSFFYGEHKQKHYDDLVKTAEIAGSNQEARHFEQQRQDKVNESSTNAAKRESKLLADAAAARNDANSLRGTTDALKRASEKSIASALASLDLTTQLLNSCTGRYLGVAEAAQRADSEARELREAWPK